MRADVLEHVKVLCQHHHLNDGLRVNVCSNTTFCVRMNPHSCANGSRQHPSNGIC